MSGEEFKAKLDDFFNLLQENLKDKEQYQNLETNFNELKDLCN